MKKTAFLLVILMVSGCASQIMKSYIGHPVTDVIADYGPPTAGYETGKNEKMLIWERHRMHVNPGTSYTTGSVYGYGNSASYFGNTYTTPATVSSSDCNYVLYARHTNKKLNSPAGWTVTGFKEPNIMCQ